MKDRQPMADPAVWPFVRSPGPARDPIVHGLLALAAASALFVAFPAIDVWFSALFYSPGEGFPLAKFEALRWLRGIGDQMVMLAIAAMAVAIAVKLAVPTRRTMLSPRDMLLVFSTLVIAPGILVNVIFKSNWGRPRPVAVDAFGGEFPFVRAWEITDYCARNCSFVSGEASSALWAVTLALFFPPNWRAPVVAVLMALAVLLSLNRVAFGGHFLSDVILSWAMTLTVIAVVYRILTDHPPEALTDSSFERALTKAGVALRRTFRRS